MSEQKLIDKLVKLAREWDGRREYSHDRDFDLGVETGYQACSEQLLDIISEWENYHDVS